MPRIFINYRRDDTLPYAGRVYDRLAQHFGRDNVFMDIDSLPPGVDFVETLQKTVESCDVLLAMIGSRWLSATDEDGNKRLSNPEDFVAVELSAALARSDIRVVPLLVSGARMPRSTDLPLSLAPLARRNALELPDKGFHDALGKLIAAIESAEKARLEREQAEAARKAEEARIAREQVEAARQAEQARIAREEAEAARRAEQTRKARQEAVEARKAEQERIARERAEAARNAEQARIAREKSEAEHKAEQERIAREAAEAARNAEQARIAHIEAEAARKVEQARLAHETAENALKAGVVEEAERRRAAREREEASYWERQSQLATAEREAREKTEQERLESLKRKRAAELLEYAAANFRRNQRQPAEPVASTNVRTPRTAKSGKAAREDKPEPAPAPETNFRLPFAPGDPLKRR